MPYFTVRGPVALPASEDALTTAWVAAVVGDGGSVSTPRRLVVDALISGLRTDGLITKLDRLWIFAAENPQSALRDLIAAAAATPVSAPSFTADSGYLGDSTNYIDSGFNATTAPSPKYTQDSAHWSHWNLTNNTEDRAYNGNNNNSAGWQFFSAGSYARVNDNGGPDTVADPRGHMIASRASSSARTSYQNGSSLGAISVASGAVVNASFSILWDNVGAKSPTRVAAYSLGSNLNGGSDAVNFYNRMRTYMTAVGVP